MKWYVIKKAAGYKVLAAVNPPRSEGPIVGEAPTFAEASLIAKGLMEFDGGIAAKGNA